jgi:peptidoglycan hydrolase-like protein with peptidoglycan-binding domain
VKTKIRNRNWEKWGMLPPSIMDYVDEDVPISEPEPTPVATEGCPYAELDRNLKKGFTGEGVKWVQWMLTHCGYSVSSCGIDGDFGKATHAAVIQFQTEHQLEADGIVGPLTRTALKAEYEKKKGA